MARLKRGILGGIIGKVGNVVGSSWKGIDYIKTLPLSVANPNSAAQQSQRTKFGYVQQFASRINSELIKPLWDRFASRMSGYNDFCKTNITLFAAGLPSPAASLVISSGKMVSTPIDAASVANANADVTIDWVDDSDTGLKLATDKAYGLAVNATQDVVGVSAAEAVRSDSTLTVTLSENVVTADVVHCYLAFKRADGTIVSNTSYLQASF